MVGDANNIYI